MFYISSIRNNLVGITDTYDNIEEFYSVADIKEFPSHIKINGVSSKGIKKINLGEAVLTRNIVKKINCEKELSFEVVDLRDILKYKLAGARDISNDFIALETDTSIKLISDKTIMLNNDTKEGLFEDTFFTKIDFHNTNTSNISDMRDMFWNCHATSLDLSSFDTSNVKNMDGIFWDCHATSLDLSSFDTSNVENMVNMFDGCHATSLDLSNFDTSKVKVMKNMFMNCQATSINLSSFDTSSVENMWGMFNDCYATSLDLSSFDTSNIKDMKYMFASCHATFLDLSNFDTSNVKKMNGMFENYRGIIKSTDDRLLLEYKNRRLN